MHIKTVRILNTILTLVFIAIGKYHFIAYVLINQVLLEVLNAQPLYKTHPYKLYNFVFWTYELVLTERLRHFKMSERAEWWLNSFEHICFALVIGFMLYMLLAIFWLKKDSQRMVRAIAVALLFNLIGLLNELNQNRLANRPIFVFIEDSVKDLKMNLIGTCIFFLTVLCRTWWLKKKSNG
jgi:VanZ family protein